MSEQAVSLTELKEQLGSGSGFSDIKTILSTFLDRLNIDQITRLKENELDKVCNFLHHAHKISVLMNKRLFTKKEMSLKSFKPVMHTGEAYVIQNLSLRLSLDSKSREELVNIFVSLIKTEIDLEKAKSGENGE